MGFFQTQLELACTPEEAFDYLSTPQTIQTISPDKMGLNYLKTPEVYHHGAIIEFQVISFGQIQTITHEVTKFERPGIFSEKMVKGPVPFWVHTHKFEDLGNGLTLVVDEIEFQPPKGLLGFLINETRILDDLEQGMDERQRLLLQIFNK
jgi:ligand-binding SRPBCC domain-containing protein